METGNNCRCLLEICREAHVELGTAFRPTAETDVTLPRSAESSMLDDLSTKTVRGDCPLDSPKDLWKMSEKELNSELMKTYPLDQIVEFAPQSGPEGQDVGMPANEETVRNILFKDQSPGYCVDVEESTDPTRMLQDTNDVELQDFFERPVRIFDEGWGTGTNFNHSFNPWERFFRNKRVGNRINNFNLLRAKLHLKIMINGNGFQYGRALVAYHPLFAFDEVSTHSAGIGGDLVQTSQLPHIFLDPTTSTGGEMHLPFFWHKNNVKTVGVDLERIGTIFIRTINSLRHANDAPDTANVTIMAWATGVELNVLTSRNVTALSPQAGKEGKSKKKTMNKSKGGSKKTSYTSPEASGKEVDEANHSGMVSGPATAISKAAGALAFIPQIAPFAMATSKVAGTVATVAKALGYSRPVVTKNPDPLRPTPASQLATTNTPDTAIKLTVDDKQELTIDPAIAGIGSEDPLSIRGIASRESYLNTFPWNIGTARDGLLCSYRVQPTLWRETGAGAEKAYHLPACAMAAMPFQYWTGTMKFRFQIVASTFHKGRLAFVYDPNSCDPLDHEFNVNYIEVVDIAESRDFTIEIGNGQEYTLLTHDTPATASQNDLFRTSSTLFNSARGNGTLNVYVLNQLTTPTELASGANDISINCFVSMGDDFEVFAPDGDFQNFVLKPQMGLEPQMGVEEVPESENTDEPNAPEQSKSDDFAMHMQDTALINKVYTGEAITSFRPLLKRYNLWLREPHGNSGSQELNLWRKRRNMFPAFRGSVPDAVHFTDDVQPYNFMNTVLLHWITMAHQGWRGSIRYKLFMDVSASTNATNMGTRVYVERDYMRSVGDPDWESSWSSADDVNTDSEAAAQILPDTNPTRGHMGMAFQTSHINNCLEWEVPYYSRYRFSPGKKINYTGSNAETFAPGYWMHQRIHNVGRSVMDYHVAAGEDFQVYFWTGMPRLYWEPIAPDPA